MAARGLGAGRGCSARCGKRRGGGIAEVRRPRSRCGWRVRLGSAPWAVGEAVGWSGPRRPCLAFPHSPTPDPRRSVEGLLPAVLPRPAPWACGRGLRARERGWGRRAVRSKATTTSSSSCWWATAMWARARSWKAYRTARPNPRTPTATVRRPAAGLSSGSRSLSPPGKGSGYSAGLALLGPVLLGGGVSTTQRPQQLAGLGGGLDLPPPVT